MFCRNVRTMNALALTIILATGCDSAGTLEPASKASIRTGDVPALAYQMQSISMPIGGTYQVPSAPTTFRELRRIGRVPDFRSVDTNVATVSSLGLVLAKSSGATLLLCNTTNSSGVDTIVVHVGRGPSALGFGVDTLLFKQIGETARVAPAENRYHPQGTSTNTAIATISSTGLVTAIGLGTTTIEFVDLTGARGHLPVKVSTLPVHFPFDSIAMKVGEVTTVQASGGIGAVQYKSLDPSIASVSLLGEISAHTPGRVAILATDQEVQRDTLWVRVNGVEHTPEDLTIRASLIPRHQGNGSLLVSNAIPLPPGLVAPGMSRRIRVFIGSVEQRIHSSELAGRHKDGSLRAVLIQFPYPSISTPVSADIVIGTTDRQTIDPAIQASGIGDPSAVLLPTDPSYLVSTDLVGPTLTAAESYIRFGGLAKRYDDDFAKYSNILYANYGDGWGENYYDRVQAYYAMWVRTGRPEYWDRATRLLLSYRRDYLEANNYGTSPHWSQVDGLGLHYLLTGDQQSRYAISKITETLWYFRVRLGLGRKDHGSIENRIRSRVLMAHLWAWRLSDSPGVLAQELSEAYTAAIGAQESDGSYRFTVYCDQSLNYMDGMLNEALIQIYINFRQDPLIIQAVERNVDWLWSQWVDGGQGFRYVPKVCPGVGETNPVPELNGLIINGFAWVYSLKKNATHATRADLIFKGSVEKSFLTGSKQFNQQYSTGWRYFAWRSQ